MSTSLNDLSPGMILSEDIHNFQGLLLLKKNTRLSDKNIHMLKSWGISSVRIVGKGTEKYNKNTKSENELKVSVLNEMKKKFSGLLEDPVMEEIMNTATELIVQKRMKNG